MHSSQTSVIYDPLKQWEYGILEHAWANKKQIWLYLTQNKAFRLANNALLKMKLAFRRINANYILLSKAAQRNR